MKKVNFCSVVTLVILMMVGTFVKAETLININGESSTTMGKYTVTEIASEEVKGEMMRKFEIKYENAKEPVVVYLRSTAKCNEYSVLSNGLDIQYLCNKKGFGARKLSGKLLRHSPDVDALFVNADELARQEKISAGELPVDEALGYIACYYPSLVKHKDLL
jgi:hypothetical protein